MKCKGNIEIEGVASVYVQIVNVSGSYTVQKTDNNALIMVDSASASTITLPANVDNGFQVGLGRSGDGAVTYQPPAGGETVVEANGLNGVKKDCIVTLVKRDPLTWLAQGGTE